MLKKLSMVRKPNVSKAEKLRCKGLSTEEYFKRSMYLQEVGLIYIQAF